MQSFISNTSLTGQMARENLPNIQMNVK